MLQEGLTSPDKGYHYVCLTLRDLGERQGWDPTPELESFLDGMVHIRSWQIWCVIFNPKNEVQEKCIGPCFLQLWWEVAFSVWCSVWLPVGQVCALPPRVPISEDKLSHIWHPTSGLLHHFPGLGIRLPSDFQPKELLHFLQFFNHDATLSLPFNLFPITLQVVVVLQVRLMKDNIILTLEGNLAHFSKDMPYEVLVKQRTTSKDYIYISWS